MSDLREFFDNFDELKPDPAVDEDGRILVGDDQMERAEREILPVYSRMAERAGVELGDIVERMNERFQMLPGVFVTRVSGGRPFVAELEGLLQTISVECFLAGVLFQQGREMEAWVRGDGS